MKNEKLSLNKLKIGEKGEVVELLSSGNERRRMLDLGIVAGTTIEAVQKSPPGDPVAYFIRGAVIALRDDDARKVIIELRL